MPDWTAWHRFIAERSRMPFAGYDERVCCALFAAGAVEALTGRDPLERIGHRWTTPRGALRVLRRVGGLADGVSAVLEPVPVGLARRGDIGFVPAPEGGLGGLVVIEGDHVVGPDANGVRRLPRAAITRSWRAA